MTGFIPIRFEVQIHDSVSKRRVNQLDKERTVVPTGATNSAMEITHEWHPFKDRKVIIIQLVKNV